METLNPDDVMLTAGLDHYKMTMSQFELDKFADVQTTFTFKNRSPQPLSEFVNPEKAQEQLDHIRAAGWHKEELYDAAGLHNTQGERVFSNGYLDFLKHNTLPAVEVSLSHDSDLHIESTGATSLSTFWETVVMSEINELYFAGKMAAEGISMRALHQEGDRRLTEKIAYFNAHPDIKFIDFGTRRRLSRAWHQHVLERLATECPNNFMGTSNVYFAHQLGSEPIGTFAHELPMIYAGVADARGEDIRASHGQMLDDWYDFYGPDLSSDLSDTFGSDFFFDSFTTEQARKHRGTRQDSGDPIAYGEKAMQFYQQHGIDPHRKSIIFSDSLNLQKVDRIHKRFGGKIIDLYGIGTFLTNDVGLTPGNNVMKATRVELEDGHSADLVKLSDDAGKHTGPAKKVAQYQQIFSNTINQPEEMTR